MNTIDETLVYGHLTAGLRERAADVGGEGAFASQVAAAATGLPQRRALLGWPDVAARRGGLILVAALIGAGLIAAAIGGGDRLALTPTPMARDVRNGPILVIDTRVSWWIDSASGAKLTGPEYPDMPGGIQDASFSPDGRRVALLVDGALELFDLTTGERTTLVTCSRLGWKCLLETERRFSIAWSPDGRSIAVARNTWLSTIDVASGAIAIVTEPLRGSFSYSGPSWSPDGQWIAFEDLRDGNPVDDGRIVEVVRPDGTGRQRVSAPTSLAALGAGLPAWSTDGTRIFYIASDPFVDTGDFLTSGWPIYAAAQRVADGAPVGEPVRVAELVYYHCLGFCPTMTLSPDGSSILLDSGDGIFVVPLDGSPRLELGNNGARPLAWRPIPAGS